MEETLQEEIPLFPKIGIEKLQNCKFSSWFERYRTIIPKAKILQPLFPSFIHYLNQDGLFYPHIIYSTKEDDNIDDDTTSLQILNTKIKHMITSLNGAVFPKLNWTAPKDAAWITPTRTLRCTTISDIYLLLKSSDHISYNLSHAFDICLTPYDLSSFQHELILKQWFDVLPSMEFRCFVYHRQLIGISQRDLKYYAFLEPLRSTILSLSTDLFYFYLRDTFPDENFVFDIYIPPSKSKAWLIDINLWHSTTSSLLFSWKELINNTIRFNDGYPQLRLVDKNGSPWGPSQFTGQRFSDDLLNPDNFDIEKYIKKLQDINISTDATNKQS
ncbi:hypothetical protein PCANB_002433 [Pneumocystis canis]|nr:hypothetical protein PCK1_002552 [Pneumocystis canis]KAG5438713.1 hypothetical protein PCANB_002433 [Pneumocystis canis]